MRIKTKRPSRRGEIVLGTLLFAAAVLAFGYTYSRVFYSHSLESEVSEKAEALDRLAEQARLRSQRITGARSADPALGVEDPAVAQAYEGLARHYEREATRVRSGVRQDYEEIRSRAAPDPARFVGGLVTGLPLDDLVFIAGDYSDAYGSGAMQNERSRVEIPNRPPPTIRSRILEVAAVARLHDAHQSLQRENPELRGITFDDPRVFTLVQNRAYRDVRNRYASGRGEHVNALERVVQQISGDEEKPETPRAPRTTKPREKPERLPTQTTQRPSKPTSTPTRFSGKKTQNDPSGASVRISATLDVTRRKVSGHINISIPPGMDITRMSGPFTGTFTGTASGGKWSGKRTVKISGRTDEGVPINQSALEPLSGVFNGRSLTIVGGSFNLEVVLHPEK